MTRRVSGLVKQRRRRAQKRADIRAGRKMSMQQMLHHAQHVEKPVQDLPVIHVDSTHELVRIDADGEQVILGGTEGRLRGMRAKLMVAAREGEKYSVRKVRYVA